MARFVVVLLLSGCVAEVGQEEAESSSELTITPLGTYLATGVSSACLRFADDRCCPSTIPRITGTAGPDVMAHGGAASCIRALPGADIVTANSVSNVVLGGDGADTVTFNAANRFHGGTGGDHLFGSPGADVVFGDDGIDLLDGRAGDDTIFGGLGNDTIDGGDNNDRLLGGPGLDDVRGGNGGDTLVVGSACEVLSGERLDGGAGTDTVVSPFTAAQLGGMGVILVSIERFVVAKRGLHGGCLLGSDNVAHCTCCDEAHRDPSATCEYCLSGYQLADAYGPLGPDERSTDLLSETRTPRPVCERVPQTCSELLCAPGSTCVLGPFGGHCECGPHQTGPTCSECEHPYTKHPVTGVCELGEPCDAIYCGGTGFCYEQPDGSIGCRCPSGAPGCGQPGTPTPVPSLPLNPRDELVLNAAPAGPRCGAFSWSIVSGGGDLDENGASATYHANFTPEGDIDYVTVRAVPAGCPMQAQDFEIAVLASGAFPITGSGGPEFAALDQAIIDHMNAHDIPGGAVIVTFKGERIYNRGFGTADGVNPMRPSNFMRLASVTKPITRAALHELIADGLLEEDLSDLAWPILQGGGADVLGLGADAIPRAPLAATEYETAASVSVNDDGDVTPVAWRAGPGGNLTTGSCRTINVTDRRTDARWSSITVADLFNHMAGFYRAADFIDPLTTNDITGDMHQAPIYVSNRLPLVVTPPPTHDDYLHFLAGTCLYYPPRGGTLDDPTGALGEPLDPWGLGVPLPGDHRYANVGFNLLGRIIERVSGESYADYVQEHVFDANGITEIEWGRTPLAERRGREALYFERAANVQGDVFSAECSVGPGPSCSGGTWTFPNPIATPDGGNFAIEHRDSSGGMIATTCGLADFMRAYRVSSGERRSASDDDNGGGGLMTGKLPGTSALMWQLSTTTDVRTPMPGVAYDDLPESTVTLTAGYHVAAIFNRDLLDEGDEGYDDGIHNASLLYDRIALALEQADGHDFTPVGCDICGDGVREGDEECDGADFGGASCGSHGFVMGDLTCTEACVISTALCDGLPEPVPVGEDAELIAGCDGTESDGDPGCSCMLTDTSALDACSIDPDSFGCEQSQPDGADFDDRFCPGEDVVCGMTTGGNPICRQCGTGDGEAQEGCPCDVVDCVTEGLGCWGDGEWGTSGRCWDQDEPPDHICIEECGALSDSTPEGYHPVCVGPHTGHSGGSPHGAASSYSGHPSYCASSASTGDCAVLGWCEESGEGVCGPPSEPPPGNDCAAQCAMSSDCAALGFPSFVLELELPLHPDARVRRQARRLLTARPIGVQPRSKTRTSAASTPSMRTDDSFEIAAPSPAASSWSFTRTRPRATWTQACRPLSSGSAALSSLSKTPA
jgi:CubicO group peptidase (beta-lactamase class C family)